MKIAVISDIHENYHNLLLALKEIKKRKIKQIIFLGDFINGGLAKVLAASAIPTFAIWGNNDGDKVVITKTSMGKGSNLTMSDNVYDFLVFDKRKIFITHFPDLTKPMAQSGIFDAVFYGHDHNKSKTLIGNCLIVNPGEISAHKTGVATFAIYDTQKNDIDFIELKKAVSLKTKNRRKI
ncbi:MAG: YfcE family phosphodiesterase [Candidatus Uhrbacteria bacterium]